MVRKFLASLGFALLSILFSFSFAYAQEVPAGISHGSPRIRAKSGTSTNWAGYASLTSLANPLSGAVSGVIGSWVVPAYSCAGVTQNTYSSAWVGIDGYSDSTVEQTGTEHDCINGLSSYYAWYEMYPKPGYRIPLAIKAGDLISAQVNYQGGGKFQLVLANLTTGKSYSKVERSNRASRESAEWIMEAPWSGGVLPLTNFGTITFSSSSATINGATGPINNSGFVFDKIDMVNASGVLKATTSALNPAGDGFSVTWNSN